MTMVVAAISVSVTSLEGPRLPFVHEILFPFYADYGAFRAARMQWFGVVDGPQKEAKDALENRIALWSDPLPSNAQPTVLARGITCKYCTSFWLSAVAALAYWAVYFVLSWHWLLMLAATWIMVWVVSWVWLKLSP